MADHGPGFGGYRPEFCEGLGQEDEAMVWKFIEQNYLGNQHGRRRVAGELCGMPGPLAARIYAWQANLDTREPVGEVEHGDFDYEASDAEGLEVAKEVKMFSGDDHYVEFRSLREISVQNGGPVELEVPRFITDLAR